MPVLGRLILLLPALCFAQSAEPPRSWVDPDTGHRVVRLTDEPGSASLYFNLFCGDGGDVGQVAHAPDGKWIYLFRAESPNRGGIDEKGFIHAGVLHAERLVNMSKHNYRQEPNVSFTPDQKWVVFRSNMFGPSYAFAVEIAKP